MPFISDANRATFRCPAPAAQFRIVFNRLLELVIGLVRHVVLEDVQNEAFLDGLTHRILMESDRQPVRTFDAESLKRHVSRRRGEGEEAEIGLRSAGLLIVEDQILDIFA